MSQHTRNDPALYHPPVSLLWWTRKRTYFVFVMRELSSIFIAWLILYLLLFDREGKPKAAFDACWAKGGKN